VPPFDHAIDWRAFSMEKSTMTMTEVETKQRNRGGRPVGAYGIRRRRQQRFDALVAAYSAEIGGSLNETDKALAAQAASIGVHIEKLQAEIIQGCDVDEDMVVRLSSEHRRLLTSLRSTAAKAKPAGDAALKEFLANLAASDAEDVA
jgi:hypothetical protein